MICYTSTKCQKNHKVGQVELSWHLYNFRLGFMFVFFFFLERSKVQDIVPNLSFVGLNLE